MTPVFDCSLVLSGSASLDGELLTVTDGNGRTQTAHLGEMPPGLLAELLLRELVTIRPAL